jgi:C1A family cysteine protease
MSPISRLFFGSILFIYLPLQAQLPDAFDLRKCNDQNYVSCARSQRGGTCWTHGTMAALESNLLVTSIWQLSGQQGEPDLAEYHLDWWNGFNNNNNDDLSPSAGAGLIVHQGGDYRIAAAYLSRGEGAVREIDAPDYLTAPQRSGSAYQYFYVNNIEWYQAGFDLSKMNTIKHKLMEFGALGTCLFASSLFLQDNVHYQPLSSSFDPDHAVAIVGWDDYKTTQYSKPGAWLCKNSWGENFGDHGYFWISYYDKHCGQHPEMGAVSFQDVEKLRYHQIYYHDYHGWRDTRSDIGEAFNAFQSKQYEQLEAVSFFTATDSVVYELVVYDRFRFGDLSRELANIKGFINHQGFHTIRLNIIISLVPCQQFYVYLGLSDGGHPIDCTSDVPVLLGAKSLTTVISSALPGQSFYRNCSQWKDLFEDDSTANFCIKALTTFQQDYTKINNEDNQNPFTCELLPNYPNPFNAATVFNYRLDREDFVELKVYDLSGQLVKTFVNENQSAGYYTYEWIPDFLPSGVYIYQLKVNHSIAARKCLFLK